MPRCPNCGRETKRTEDWACQWCGYPLLSRAYKKIPKTYRQLEEERGHKALERESPAGEELEPARRPERISKPEPEPEPVSELEYETVPEDEPINEPELKPAVPPQRMPVPRPEQIGKSELAPEPISQSEAEPEPVAEPISKPEAEPEPVPEPISQPEAESEPVPEPEPISKPAPEPELMPALEMTVDQLLSAYEAEGPAADARFAQKVLRITGVVHRIEIKTALDIYYITLNAIEKTVLLQEVRCFFDRGHRSELSLLSSGQTVTVQGKYDGSLVNIRMTDCLLVH